MYKQSKTEFIEKIKRVHRETGFHTIIKGWYGVDTYYYCYNRQNYFRVIIFKGM